MENVAFDTRTPVLKHRNIARARYASPTLILLVLLTVGLGWADPVESRWITVPGAINFRDVGGLDAGSNRVIPRGRIFRSDALHALNTTGVETLRDLGIRVIIDLRAEWAGSPDVAALDEFTTHVYLLLDFASGSTWPAVYQGTFLRHGAKWRRALEIMADPTSYPINYHCAAGRDRAGIMTAILLSLLGVDRQTIIDDFMLSTLKYPNPNITPTCIEAVLDEIAARGGIDAYLESIGVTASVRKAVRRNLLIWAPMEVRQWQYY